MCTIHGPCASYFGMNINEIKRKFKSGEFYEIKEEKWLAIKEYLTKHFNSPTAPREFLRERKKQDTLTNKIN